MIGEYCREYITQSQAAGVPRRQQRNGLGVHPASKLPFIGGAWSMAYTRFNGTCTRPSVL